MCSYFSTAIVNSLLAYLWPFAIFNSCCVMFCSVVIVFIGPEKPLWGVFNFNVTTYLRINVCMCVCHAMCMYVCMYSGIDALVFNISLLALCKR